MRHPGEEICQVFKAQGLVYALTFCPHAGGPLIGEGPETAGFAIATDWRWGHRVEHGVSEKGVGILQEGKGYLQGCFKEFLIH